MLRLIKNILIFSSLFSFILAEDLALGSSIPLPDVKMVDISGKKVSLNDVKMKNGLLVNFSCNTCPWVVAWQSRYNGLAKASAENNIGFITINPNARNREKIGEGLKGFGVGGFVSGLAEGFGKWIGASDPVEKFQKFAAIGPGLKDAGD